jgi:hypothetical protein
MTMTITARTAKAEKHLEKLHRYEGQIMTYARLIDSLKAKGGTAEIVQVTDAAKRKRAAISFVIMRRGWIPTGNEKHPETIRYRQLERDTFEATKPEYRLSTGDGDGTFITLTKTAYDYATR